jgi:hypothetical protein
MKNVSIEFIIIGLKAYYRTQSINDGTFKVDLPVGYQY